MLRRDENEGQGGRERNAVREIEEGSKKVNTHTHIYIYIYI